jgi:formate--tetrahydrofolate ligase
VKKFGLPAVVVLNRFPTDTEAEVEAVIAHCENLGVRAVTSTAWADGGAGSLDLAQAVLDTIEERNNDFSFLYNLDLPVKDKIELIAKEFYGAEKVAYGGTAARDLKRIAELGMDKAPICIAKTQKSLSDDPSLKGRPEGFTFHVRGIEIAAGAGFVIPLSGDLMRMPGLPKAPAAQKIDIDSDGNISGLF